MEPRSEDSSTPASEQLKSQMLLSASELEYEKNHAQFLGYKTEEIDSNILSLTPENTERLWWWWLVKRDHGVLARRIMSPARPGAPRSDILEFVNAINCLCEAVCVTLECNKNGEQQMFAQSFLEGQYNRSNFTIFMDRINHELSAAVTNDAVLEAWSRISE